MVSKNFTSRLLTITVELLKTTDIPLKDLAADLHVSKVWLWQVQHGKIKNPSVHKIERLHQLLTGRRIVV